MNFFEHEIFFNNPYNHNNPVHFNNNHLTKPYIENDKYLSARQHQMLLLFLLRL